ncbi:MAG: phage tail sheath subtilisin-like domain-containing protein [Anaerolineae bacterium]|nr:phage tail sheath subtilisin-like domain-containing protein [Anaerolineae bacterium]
MPEYLAPGVYVEETSFRSKSIEGVGTSTAGFVGPTRTGPFGETPELITSLSDFEQVYGGLEDLSFGTNYLAHAVRAFFTEGGSRLYVSRVFLASGNATAVSPQLVATADATEQVRFVARFPGSGGNGAITLIEVSALTTQRGMDNARVGSMIRVGGANPATTARLVGGMAPFGLTDGAQLALTVNGTDGTITFRGEHAQVTAADPLPDDVNLAQATTLTVTIDGAAQTVTLAAGTLTRAQFVGALNARLRGGYATLSNTNQLIIGSDTAGTRSSISVNANPAASMFPAGAGTLNPANNNVGSLAAVTADEINALLLAATIPAQAALDATTGRLVLSTTATGTAATLAVRDTPDATVRNVLGLAAGPVSGAAGDTLTYYVKGTGGWADAANAPLNMASLTATTQAALLTITAIAVDADGKTITYEGMGFAPSHPRYIGTVLTEHPTRRTDALENPFFLQLGTGVSPFELQAAFFGATSSRSITLSSGSDGLEPTQAAYEAALEELQKLEDIAIVAGPGASSYSDAQGIQGALITHAETRRAYRIAVLDSQPGQSLGEVRTQRSQIDSKYAALYYPWVIVSNPLARPGDDRIPRELVLPPSGYVCGIYARNDIQRGVHKAPANEVVRSALRFERDVNFAQQEVLNPLGINCLRLLSGRGYRVWGARLISSDPEFKYVSDRRYMNYLEYSIDRGMQWAVFEPNGPRLWSNITDTVSAFLYNEWVSGALLGNNEKEAFFVRCDRSTMTQNDLDNGRLICLVGVAIIKPAEFVIFRIGQKTADARS